MSLSKLLLCCGLIFGSVSQILGDQNAALAEKMIVVVNRNDPHSLSIGQHYAKMRGIPEANIVQLETSTKETITIKEYVTTIANPLLNALLEGEWVQGVKGQGEDKYGRERLAASFHEIPFVVLIRGIPLRIANDPALVEPHQGKLPKQFLVNNGSVDGELTLLLAPAGISMTSFVLNPYLENDLVSKTDANRILKVSRLDGPTKSDVINLIDRSIEAEKTGLMGRAYFDTGGPHNKGDEWIRAAGEIAEANHFDTDFEVTKRTMDYSDRYDAPAIYMGWYRTRAYAQWSAPTWPVPKGAIGFHLHSFSGTSVRNGKSWLSAFIAQGYCATIGNVYEPYLEYTHRPHVFLEHLMKGGDFGTAAFRSMPALSWQSVAIGDPLFRPFKVDLASQLAESSGDPFAAYASVREINRLLATEGNESAISYAREQFTNQPSLALAFRVAQLYSSEGRDREAVEVLKVIRFMTAFSLDEFVLVQKIANFLHKRGESALALRLYKSLLEERRLNKSLKVSLFEGGAPIAEKEGESVTASRWILEAKKLKAAPQSKGFKK